MEDTTAAIPKFGEQGFADLRERVTKLRTAAFRTGFSPGTGHRPYFVTPPVALWLERRLDFPNWDPRSIDTMPTTHIAEWAKEHEVAMDPLYATEHREGGTRALGDGIPGVKREQLHVYSDEEWTALRDKLTHESWRKQAH